MNRSLYPKVVKMCRGLLLTLAAIIATLVFSPISAEAAQGTRKCYCHNICHDSGDTFGEQCTSAIGQQQGHQKSVDCHACLEAQGASCDKDNPNYDNCDAICQNGVEDTLGKCDGCGDGEPDEGEECDDGNNEDGDGCSQDCKTECASNEDCADQNPCTDDICSPETHACVHPNNDAPCNDDKFCTDNDVCLGGACNGTPITCADDISCNIDTCNEEIDDCEHENNDCNCESAEDCDDSNPCTSDSCEENNCQYENNAAPCDDGLHCNGSDTCGGGTCSVHAGDPCSEGGECADSCNEEGQSCSDPAGVSCTDDANLCTNNVCNGEGACVLENNTADCDDSDACTGGDSCEEGQCVPGEDICDDSGAGGDGGNDPGTGGGAGGFFEGSGCGCSLEATHYPTKIAYGVLAGLAFLSLGLRLLLPKIESSRAKQAKH